MKFNKKMNELYSYKFKAEYEEVSIHIYTLTFPTVTWHMSTWLPEIFYLDTKTFYTFFSTINPNQFFHNASFVVAIVWEQ